MKQYPLGSICIIVNVAPENHAYLHRECTIVGLPGCDEAFPDMYQIDVQGDAGKRWFSVHEGLRLKKFPPDLQSDCEEFMRKVLSPIEETA